MTTRLHRSGFTLVELMVTLGILAALATVAAVSTAGLRERELTAETVRLGESVRVALERDEGLSFVSDLGFVPSDLGTLAALRQVTYDPGLVLEADGSVTPSGVTVQLPLFTVCTTSLLPTNVVLAADQALKLTNELGVVRLGAGWRGPYAAEKFALKSAAEPCLADPWGRAWEVSMTNGLVTVTSRGRDGAIDEGTAEWADCDRSFTTRPVDASTLVLSVRLPDGLEETAGTLEAFLYEPQLVVGGTGLWRTGLMTLKSRRLSASVATTETTLAIEQCTVGLRAVWCYVTIGTHLYAAPPQLVAVRAGNTIVELTLRERL